MELWSWRANLYLVMHTNWLINLTRECMLNCWNGSLPSQSLCIYINIRQCQINGWTYIGFYWCQNQSLIKWKTYQKVSKPLNHIRTCVDGLFSKIGTICWQNWMPLKESESICPLTFLLQVQETTLTKNNSEFEP